MAKGGVAAQLAQAGMGQISETTPAGAAPGPGKNGAVAGKQVATPARSSAPAVVPESAPESGDSAMHAGRLPRGRKGAELATRQNQTYRASTEEMAVLYGLEREIARSDELPLGMRIETSEIIRAALRLAASLPLNELIAEVLKERG